MPYYGDYYAGDPGLFSGLGKIFKGALGIASKVVPGPIGTIAGVTSRLVGGGQRTAMPFQTGLGAAAPRRRRARRLKFGSAAWRAKYGRKRRRR